MNEKSPLAIIILAAGKGTRMKSKQAKVLHSVYGRPMVEHVISSTNDLASQQRIVVIGHQAEAVQRSLAQLDCDFVLQKEQLGTAHAVLAAENSLVGECEDVLILCGDTPLLRGESLLKMYQQHRQEQATVSVMTTVLNQPTNYGRIINDAEANPIAIVEEKDATVEQRKICEINAGIYCVNRKFLYDALRQVDSNNSQGEFYLTDIISLAVKAGEKARKYVAPNASDVLGVNSRIELAQAEAELQMRANNGRMLDGVSLRNPSNTYISPECEVGQDCIIESGVALRGNCIIGEGTFIDRGVILDNCTVAANSHIGAYTVISNATISGNIAPQSTKV